MSNQAGKGDRPRDVNKKVFDSNFDAIFGKPKYEREAEAEAEAKVVVEGTFQVYAGKNTSDRIYRHERGN